MKQEIKEAYNRMNPPQEAKERMMRNIQRKQNKKDGFYTASPAPVRVLAAIPAAMILICVLVGGWWILTDPGQDAPELGESIPAVETEPDVVSHVGKVQEINWKNVPEIYRDILTKYQTALIEKWDAAQWERNNLNQSIPQRTDNLFDLGYSLVDLNSDGEEELLISDGTKIYDLYFVREDAAVSPMQISQDGKDMDVHLVQDGLLYSMESSSFGVMYHIWKLGADGLGMLNLVGHEVVIYTTDGKWYAGPNEKGAIAVTEAEAKAILEKYQTQTISVTRFVTELEKELKYPRTYVQMMRELMSVYSGVATMDVALVDVSGDGEEELLLGIRDSFGHVYSVVDGQVEEVLTYGADINFTLCKDGVICHHEADKPFGNYTFISMKDNENRIIEHLAYDEDQGSWVRERSGNREYITQEEFQKVIDSYGSVKLTMISVLEFIAG